MTIGLIDVDSKIPNLALMKISSYYKALGEKVEFLEEGKEYDKIYASSIFTRNKKQCEDLKKRYGDLIDIGGTGWDLKKQLPDEIDRCKPDYDLYSADIIASRIRGIMTKEKRYTKALEIVNSGIGSTTKGCVRTCGFCVVPVAEGKFRQYKEIKDIINPRSNKIILHDNNITADPNVLDKLKEIKERNLIVDFNQGIDVRLMTEEIAKGFSEVKHLRSIHFAWDLMPFEKQVIEGINTLSKYIKPYKQMCFMLTGFDTSFGEDVYRFRKLLELKVDPFVMVYNQKDDKKLKHFARWVNSRIYKSCKWEEYLPWIKEQSKMGNYQMAFDI